MIVNKVASAVFNDIVSGLAGYESTISLNLELLEDEVVEERLAIIKKYSILNLIPRKDLFYSLNCIELDCKSLDKCCEHDPDDELIAHFEIPQLVNDFGEQSIEFIGSTDKQIKFKVYTSPQFRFHKYKTRRKNKPFVYIDTTPNENNRYDGYVFNAPMLERITVIAIFKDPRLVEELSCCEFTDADNLSWIVTEVKLSLIQKKLKYYRLLYPQPQPTNLIPQ